MRSFAIRLGLAVVVCNPSFAQSLGQREAPPGPPVFAQRVAEPAGPVSMGNALDLALRAHPALAAAAKEVEAADGLVLQAQARPNPSLEALVEGPGQATTRTTTVQINQPFELGDKRVARIEAAGLSRDAADLDARVKRAEVRATVVSAFYEVLAAQERVSLAEQLSDLAQRGAVAAARRVSAGRISPVEETKARVAEAAVRVELQQAKGDLAATRRKLSATWGNTEPRFERAEGRIVPLSLPTLAELEHRLDRSPSLARARLEVDRRGALTQIERSRQVPDLTVSVGAKREEEFGRNLAVIGFSIPIPLFDRNQGNIAAAQKRAEQARDELAAAQLALASGLSQAHERLRSSLLEVELIQKDILPGAQTAHDAVSRGFELGKFGFLDLLDAQRTLMQARGQHLRALVDVHRAAAEIERILGADGADPVLIQ